MKLYTLRRSSSSSIHLLVLILFLVSSNSWGSPVRQDSYPVTKESIQASIDVLAIKQGISEQIKNKIISYLKSAQDNLVLEDGFNKQSNAFKKALNDAPAQVKGLNQQLEQIQLKQGTQTTEDFSKISVDELTQRSILENEKIADLTDQINKLGNQLDMQQARLQLIRNDSLKINSDLAITKKELNALENSPSSNLELAANQTYLKTLINAKNAELEMLDNEAGSNPVRVELLKAELQFLQTQKNYLTPVADAIEAQLAKKKQQEAKSMQDAFSQAENQLPGKSAVIQDVTRENIQYSQELQRILSKIDSTKSLTKSVQRQTETIGNEFEIASKRIQLASLNPELGKLLIQQRQQLSKNMQYKEQSAIGEVETATINLDLLNNEEKLKEFIDFNDYLSNLMSTRVDSNLPIEKRMMIQAQLRVLLNDQNETLNKLSIAYSDYLRTLGDYNFARQQLHDKLLNYANYLDENLLWVKSAEPVNGNFIANLIQSVKRLFSFSSWEGVFNNTLYMPYVNPFLSALILLSLGVVSFYSKQVKQLLTDISEQVSDFETDRFLLTVKALFYSLVMVLPIPLVLFVWGWFLNSDTTIDNFSQAVGSGVKKAAISLLFLQFSYSLLSIMNIHFRWLPETVTLISRQLNWIRFVIIPCIFFIFYSEVIDNSDSDYLGRIALISLLITISVFWLRILKPKNGLLQHYIVINPNGWLTRVGDIFILIMVAIPLVIAGCAVLGYYSSAVELTQKLIISLRLFFIAIIIDELVLRSLRLANQQLAIKNRNNKIKKQEQAVRQSTQPGSDEPVLPIDEADEIDIGKVNAQTISVLHICLFFTMTLGLWVIWKNILPAFSFVDNIVLWHYKITSNKQEIEHSITMVNLLMAGLYGFITYVAVTNFSGVMEILIFSKSNIEAGSRYAIIQLTNYFIIGISVLVIASELGGNWSELQWLVAALGVGLGFGLQEIFANLVSGIILLFERPVRVGDTVTIGGVSGKVCRIHMRATTLIDWDKKEVIVPNKTFITSQLVNWTLSDAVTRVSINIGIAYGSDLEKAHRLMLDTVKSTPLVLGEPEPSVLFNDFGDSTINFIVRIFVGELGNRLSVNHDLLMRLEKVLRENNITIPFPQRDIHVYPVNQEVMTKP